MKLPSLAPSSCCALAVRFLGLATLALGSTSHAAIITWGAPTNISGDSDVSTVGSLVGAANLGADSFSIPLTSPTVNGVTFTAWNSTATTTSGIFSLGSTTGAFGTSGPVGPVATLSTAYQALVRTGALNMGPTPTLTMSGLTAGNAYQFQWWASDDGLNTATAFGMATAGNSITLDANTTNAGGGIGQFGIGTFVADGTTQVVTFASGFTSVLNGVQLRLTGTASGVPDGGSAAGLLGLALAALALARRRVAGA